MKAYFDESGKHHQASVISIFGLLMSVDTCKELQRRWFREAARTPKIPLPFHMSDCVAGSKAFAYLKNDEDARLEMQGRMIRTLRGIDTQAYGIAIIRKDYAGVTVRPEPRFQDPWFLAFEGSITEMMHASAESGKKHLISLVFDRQDEFRDRAFELYKQLIESPVSYRDRVGSLDFSPKDRLAALQAADVVVYECTRYLAEHHAGVEPRWQLSLLRQVIPITGRKFDKASLALLAEVLATSRSMPPSVVQLEPETEHAASRQHSETKTPQAASDKPGHSPPEGP